MDPQQENSDASSALLSVPRAPRFIHTLRFKGFLLTILSERAGQIRQSFSRLSSPSFGERNSSGWGSETRGFVEPKEFSVVILAHYRGWISGQEVNFQLDAVKNDPQILLEALGYAHGDKSRRWYFVMDFDVDYKDTKGVVRPLPRAVFPGTQIVVLPTRDGILGILREASAEGESGFVHFGGHCIYASAGTSDIMNEPTGKIRYTQTPNGSPIKEAFIVTTDGKRLYGREFIESLGDGTDKRRSTTLTVSLDMCNASAFFAEIVEMPYQYRGEGIKKPTTPPTRSTNQLVVISAAQRGQTAGTFNGCGALTYFLTEALTKEDHRGQGRSAAEVIRHIHEMCQGQPEKHLLQTPQITSRYKLTGTFGLLPTQHPTL